MKTPCRSCGHDRLLHDSWGCKAKCGCGVSVVYINSLRVERDEDEENETISAGRLLDVQHDEAMGLQAEELLRRAEEERPEQGS